jgi:hypothetical protein
VIFKEAANVEENLKCFGSYVLLFHSITMYVEESGVMQNVLSERLFRKKISLVAD